MICRMATMMMICAAAALPAAAETSNPFFGTWDTPFAIPPFERIEERHYQPALEHGIAEKRREIEAIAADPAPPTFANTIEALERAGGFLQRVQGVFNNAQNTQISDGLQEIAKEIAPQLSALRDETMMNLELFERVRAVWEGRDELELDVEERRLLEETYRDFVRGGALLDEADQARLKEINAELAVLGLDFADNLLADTNDFELVIRDAERLAGLPEGVRSSAAEAAADAGYNGAWLFTLNAPSIWPFLTYADDRELRHEIWQAYVSRGAHEGERDNRPLASRMAALRVERANLLGYPTHAHYVLDENMAGDPPAVYGLLWRLWNPALDAAEKEAADLQEMIDATGGDFELAPWDWRYYAEKLRSARYDLDDDALRPYFELDTVRDGAFWLAGRLWGLELVERADLPVYHPEVKTFEVRDADGSHLGVLLLDYHPRPSKRGGAWMNTYRDQWRTADGTDVRPIVVNCGNFSRPTGDTPALLSLEEVQTLFHEFGHGLHGLLAQGAYRSLSGTAVARDFVELPSQIMENWVLEPDVLRRYARHWKTGEVIPEAIVEKIQAAKLFDQGFATVEYLAASFLDMDWHTLVEPDEVDPAAFERQSMARIGLIPEIVVRYKSPYFAHIFGPGGGYSSGYYSYIWAEVLDADAYAAFVENGLFDPTTAAAFRSNVLEPGGSEPPMDLYTRFRGRAPSTDALLERKGFE